MPEKLLRRLRHLFEGNPAIRKVADDPVLTAELLLLFRMILADGVVEKSEIEMFKRICRDAFAISDESFRGVVHYLNEFGYETSGQQAMSMFRDLDEDRKRLLIRHMVDIAGADSELHPMERKLLRKTLDVLEFEDDEDLSPPG
jgi:uncharacterized tellurite resistance protein B-like protein